MPAEFKALMFDRFGPPAEVLSLCDTHYGPLAPTSARVRMLCSPINPADFNYIEGTYGIKPQLFSGPDEVQRFKEAHGYDPKTRYTGGLEGVGMVVETGSQVTAVEVGDLVAAPEGMGHWCTGFAAFGEGLYKFPAGLTPEQAAVFRINPCTAWCLLHEFVGLQAGDWVAQNAATSALGRLVIAIARHLGLRTVNLVRRPEDADRLKALGADLVVVTEGADPKAILKETGAPVRLGLNAVGGESAVLVGKLLEEEGVHVTYGAMARQPVRVSNAALIFQDISYRGFWITRWRKKAWPRERVAAMEEAVADLFRKGVLEPGIEASYPLENYAEALAHAARGGRTGKIAFRP